jgi:hypothetical protein
VVFEKFAEMNNKYDVKNFSDLIEKYNTEAEMATISATIKSETEQNRLQIVRSPFDPILESKDVT